MSIGPAAPVNASVAASDGGFTLIEVVVALMLIVVVMTSTAGFFIRGLTATRQLQLRQSATAVAAEAIETARGGPAPLNVAPTPVVVGAKRFLVSTTVTDCWIAPAGGSCASSASALSAHMWRVEVRVTWKPGPSETCPPGCSYSVTTLRTAVSATKNVKEVAQI